jgi:hypothetical protein
MYIEYEINEGKNKLYGFQIASYYTEDDNITFESIDGKQALVFKQDLIEAKVKGKIIYPEGFSLNTGKETKFYFKDEYNQFLEGLKK